MEITIGLISALVGMALGYVGFLRTRDKDVKASAAESAIVTTKLDSIGQDVRSIRVDLKVNEQTIAGVSERIIRVEEGVKQAQEGVKAVNERVDKLGGV
ncbi:hypothetical protein [Sporosarcina sp. SAFN-015]|uniref:hypothetical protein n=1 Tax=Sporosarcina sp. SAFN-015 TaxID=3387274 RepID=UPI003F801223